MKQSSDKLTRIDMETLCSIIDVMYDEVLVYDKNYVILYINEACSRHYSCTPEYMIGKSFFDFVDNNWWEPSILPTVYKEKKAYAIRQKTYTGSELLTIAIPIFDDRNEIRFVVMNVRDHVNDIDLYNPQYIAKEHKPEVKVSPIAESGEMRQVMELVHKISAVDVTCIFSGESGTGKTMIAKYMHSVSPRKNQPLVSLNCASIPNELMESELFGYVKGAFTGANPAGKKGLFEAADHGTLLLDEITELTLSAQAKLLHVLQDKAFYHLGGSKPVTVDVRVIAATSKNLKNMVEIGQFREDLYYRLNVVDIYIPPLRKRKEDVIPLVHGFLHQFCGTYGVTRQFSEKALAVLREREWPGNIRELRHVVERLVVTVDSLVIDVVHLPKNMFGIVDSADLPEPNSDFGNEPFDEKIKRYQASLVQEAYRKYGSSRKLAAHFRISQSRANQLIRKYVSENVGLRQSN